MCEVFDLVPGECRSASTPGTKGAAGDQTRDAEDDLSEEDRRVYASASGSLLYHALDRPDLQFSTDRCMSKISAPKVKDQTYIKGVARYLCGKLECVWLFDYQKKAPSEITVLCDAD